MGIVVLIAALLPAVVLTYIVYRRDSLRPEPVPQLLWCVGYGVLSVFVSFLLSGPLSTLYYGDAPSDIDSIGSAFYTAFFIAAVPEELAKLLCLIWFLRNNRYFDEYMDGIVYAVCIGMGFAGLENVCYLFDSYDAWLHVGVVRALMSVPGHCLFAILMGYYYSLWRIGGDSKSMVMMFVAPVLAHGLYDFILMWGDVDEVVGSISVFVVLYMLNRMRKWCSGLIAEHLNNDKNTIYTQSIDIDMYDKGK